MSIKSLDEIILQMKEEKRLLAKKRKHFNLTASDIKVIIEESENLGINQNEYISQLLSYRKYIDENVRLRSDNTKLRKQLKELKYKYSFIQVNVEE